VARRVGWRPSPRCIHSRTVSKATPASSLAMRRGTPIDTALTMAFCSAGVSLGGLAIGLLIDQVTRGSCRPTSALPRPISLAVPGRARRAGAGAAGARPDSASVPDYGPGGSGGRNFGQKDEQSRISPVSSPRPFERLDAAESHTAPMRGKKPNPAVPCIERLRPPAKLRF
jgi:hypothetical protein